MTSNSDITTTGLIQGQALLIKDRNSDGTLTFSYVSDSHDKYIFPENVKKNVENLINKIF